MTLLIYGFAAFCLLQWCAFYFQVVDETAIQLYIDGVIAVGCLVGSYLLYQVSRHFDQSDKSRKVWLLFAIGVLLEGIGHCVYVYFDITLNEAFSYSDAGDIVISVGEIFWVASFGLFYINLNRMAYIPRGKRDVITNISTLVFAALILYISFPSLMDESLSLFHRVLANGFVVFDLATFFFSVNLGLMLMSFGNALIVKPWKIIVVSRLIFIFSDCMYTYLESADAYTNFHWVNQGWIIAYLLIPIAALEQLKLHTRMSRM